MRGIIWRVIEFTATVGVLWGLGWCLGRIAEGFVTLIEELSRF